MKIKIYYVYVYQELFTLNERSIILDIDIVHGTYTKPLYQKKYIFKVKSDEVFKENKNKVQILFPIHEDMLQNKTAY